MFASYGMRFVKLAALGSRAYTVFDNMAQLTFAEDSITELNTSLSDFETQNSTLHLMTLFTVRDFMIDLSLESSI